MKKLFLILIVMMASVSVEAQQKSPAQQSELYKHYQLKYVFGMRYNDYAAAKNALYDLIALDPVDDSLKLNLALLYYDQSQYASCLFVASDILTRNPEQMESLQLAAVCYQNMGVRDKAIGAYESLYMVDGDINTLYQLAVLQFEVKRYSECKSNLNLVIKDPKAKEVMLTFPKGENEQQNISMEAAAYNVKGLLEAAQGNKQEARNNFTKALELYPDFETAKTELAKLN